MRDRNVAWVGFASAVGLLACAYGGLLDGAYVWDDVFLVEGNRTLHDAGGLRAIFTSDLWSSVGEPRSQLYHPLPMVTLWVQAHLGLLSVVAGRVVNLALHLVSALGLVALLRRLGTSIGPSVLIALVMLVHPSAVETVMWLTGRHDLLGVVCALTALLVWPRRDECWGRALVSALACGAALLCKETYVVAPALLAGLLWVERGRRVWLLAPSVVAVSGVLGLRHALGIPSGSNQLAAGPGEHLRNYASIAWHYSAQLVSFTDGPTIESYAQLGAGAVVAVLIGCAFACVFALRSGSRVVVLGTGWFFVGLAPHVLSLPMIGLYANRYAYFPMLGLCVVAAGATQLAVNTRLLLRRAVWLVVATLLVLGVVRSRTDAATWHDDVTLYAASVEARPEDGRALYHLGHAVQRRDGCARSLPFFAAATRFAPDYVRAWRNLAACFIDVGRPADAVAPARRAVQLSPTEASQRYNLGAALVLSGQREAGAVELREALRLDPSYARARTFLEHM